MAESRARLRDARLAIRLLRTACDRVVLIHLIVALALVAGSGLLSGLAPLALKALLDAAADPVPIDAHPVLPDGDSMRLIRLVACYVAALAGARLLSTLRPWPAGAAERRLSANLARRGFDRFLASPLAHRLAYRPGAPAHALDQAVTGCQILVSHLVGSVIPVAVELGTVVVVLIHLGQPSIMAALICTALVYLGIQSAAISGIVLRAQAVAASAQTVRTYLTEGLSQPESIQGLGLEPTMRSRLQKALCHLEGRWRTLNLHHVKLGLLNTGCIAVCLSTLMTLALAALVAGTLSTGGFVLINVYLVQLLRPIELLGIAARDMAQALGFMRPLLEMTVPDTAPSSLSAIPPTSIEAGASAPLTGRVSCAPEGEGSLGPAIRIRGVQFGYGEERPLLHDLDLDIPAGSLLALVGPSGSGKSTLVRLLLGLIEPQAGLVLLDELALSGWPLSERQAMTGVVFQDNLLIDDTLAANIALGCPDARQCDVIHAARVAQLDRCIATLPLGYDTRLGDRGVRLSGGERQRVAIARALMSHPRLLLLDEATSMLDTATEQAVLQGLRDHCGNCTILMVAHRLASIRDAQQIAVMDKGRIVERGKHPQLLAQAGVYARLWSAQGLTN